VKLVEQGSYLGHIIQRKDEFPAQLFETFCHRGKFFRAQVVPVQASAKVRRIKIEQCVGSVEARQHFLIRKGFDLDSCQSLVCAFDQLRQAVEVEAGGLDDMPVVARIQDETRKTILEEIQLTCCPLDIGQGRRVCRLQKLEPFPADEDELEISDQLLMMLLANAEKIHDLPVQIVQYFHF